MGNLTVCLLVHGCGKAFARREVPEFSDSQWNLNVQQPLGKSTVLQAAYIGNRGVHLLGTRNLNRIFPGTSAAEVRDTLQQVVGDKIEVKVLGEPHSSPPSPMRSDVMAAVTKAVQASHRGLPIVPDMAPYATVGSVFRGAGIPTYGVSSLFMKSTDEFAHGLNERIPVAAFYAGLDHWYVLLTMLAGGK